MEVNWEAIGAIGEILGALVVVATLFYLAKQVQQQNRFSSYSTIKDLLDAIGQPNQMLAQDPALRRVFNVGLEDPDRLSDEEAEQFSWVFRLYYNQMLKLEKGYSKGLVDQDDWDSFGRHFAQMLFTPGGKKWVQEQGDIFPEMIESYRAQFTEGDRAYDLTLGRNRTSQS